MFFRREYTDYVIKIKTVKVYLITQLQSIISFMDTLHINVKLLMLSHPLPSIYID